MEITALDRIDREILQILRQDGRATFSQVGKRVGLSPHAASHRIRRLQSAGVIRGFEAVVDYGTVGRAVDAFVDVRLLPTTNPDDFEVTIASLPQTRELTFVTGRFDYQLRLACVDSSDLDRALRAIRTTAGAAVTETRIVLRTRTASPAI